MTVTDLIQAIAMVVLVIVTWRYARSAKEQAEASVKMAEEMREQQRFAVQPDVLVYGSLPYRNGEISMSYGNWGRGLALNIELRVSASGVSPTVFKVRLPCLVGGMNEDFFPLDLGLYVDKPSWVEAEYDDTFGNRYLRRQEIIWLPKTGLPILGKTEPATLVRKHQGNLDD